MSWTLLQSFLSKEFSEEGQGVSIDTWYVNEMFGVNETLIKRKKNSPSAP